MKIDLLNKKTLWVVMLVIALLPVPTIIKYMQRFVVRNGVITAFRYEVRAPIDGVVTGLSVAPGSVPGDKPALLLGNSRRMGHYETLEGELTALKEDLARNENILSEYIDKITGDLDQSLAILEARLVGEIAAQNESRHRRDRTMQLVKASVATEEDADRVEAEYSRDQAQVRTTRLEIKQLKHRRMMLSQGMVPNDVSDGALQVQNRINTLQQDILACKRRMSEAKTNFTAGDDLPTAMEQDINTRTTSASVGLPSTAVVWELDVQDGMEVTKGDRLMSYIDRSRLMVEVAIDDATLELIDLGHPVRVRLFGREDFIEGTVSRVMGSAGLWHSDLFAAAIKEKSGRDGRVLVQIADDKLHGEVEKFCGVGRTAYAEFEGIGLMELYFGSFLR